MKFSQQDVTDLIEILTDDRIRMERPIRTSDLDIHLPDGEAGGTVLELIRCHCGPNSFLMVEGEGGAYIARLPGEGWKL